MPLEFAAGLIIGIAVFGGLAFGDQVIQHIASLESDPDLLGPDDLD